MLDTRSPVTGVCAMVKSKWTYTVFPRFTSGSPATVSEEIARRLAQQEEYFYRVCRDGFYDPWKLNLGVSGIVLAHRELAKSMEVVDIITGDTHIFLKMADFRDFMIEVRTRNETGMAMTTSG